MSPSTLCAILTPVPMLRIGENEEKSGGKRGGAKESEEPGYEKRDSSPSPRILLLQDIDILTGTPGRPRDPTPPGHFHG